MDYAKESLRLHAEWKGKIEVKATVPVETKDDLSLAYTPGVAQPCLEIQKDINKSYDLTRRWNLCAVITDGSAVLGLGDIGPEAGMPVMEGKCVLFKSFGDVDAFPLCVKTHDVDEFVNAVCLISGSFGGINLEDISAPRCFEIERKLKEKCDIPIFHDDQHGTAVITLAGLTNALKVVGKKKEDVKVVTSGAGAAAIAITKLLLSAGFRDITMCDRKGAIYQGREGLNWIKTEMAEVTNQSRKAGTLADMLVGADVFLGVSAPGLVTPEMVKIDPQFVTVPSRMVSRVRRDTRYTKDKTLYRANMWLFFRRARKERESVPAYYFELHPEYWAFGCWGAWGRGEMEALREMILAEDRLFLNAFRAVNSCPQVHLAGEMYKRPKFPDAKPEYQDWLNRKEIGVDYTNGEDFTPVLDGTFVPFMLKTMRQLAPLYRLLLAAKERADAAGREALQ